MSKRVNIGDINDNPRVVRPTTDHTRNLPPEILYMIFGQLDMTTRGRIAQVSHRWRDAVYQKLLWRDDEIMFRNRYFLDSYTPLITSLDQREIVRIHFNIPNGEWADIGSKIRDLFRLMPKVQSFHLSSKHRLDCCYLFTAKFEDLRPITQLQIDDCLYSEELWETIALTCPNLRSLYLGRSDSIVIYLGLNAHPVDIMSVSFPHLQSLTIIKGCKLTDDWLKSLAQNLLQLKSLTLVSCDKITDAGIGYLTGCHPGGDPATSVRPMLDALNLTSCRRLTIVTLDYLSQGQKNLKTLKISLTIWAPVFEYLSQMGQLRNLSLHWYSRVGLHNLTKIKALKRLSLTGYFDDDDLAVLANFSGIAVSLTMGNPVSDKGLLLLARIPHLQFLKLDFMSQITASNLASTVCLAANMACSFLES